MRIHHALFAIAMAGIASLGGAQTPDADGLLPVEQAFALTASAPTRDSIKLEWKIADGYYLYRSRIKTKAGAGVILGELTTPDGEKKHDEFLGDVEVYHHAANATQSFSLADPSANQVELTVIVQGCHELDPKICYPPSPTKLRLALPAAGSVAMAPTSGGPTLKSALGQLGAGSATSAPLDTTNANAVDPTIDALPLPPEQAFVFETIATSPTELLARWTMPKGYYLYRDKIQLELPGSTDVRLGTPRFPEGKMHKDEHFGDVVVYFDQLELPIPLQRSTAAARKLEISASFQGCEDGGVCYPVMARKLSFDLPEASAAMLLPASGLARTSAAATGTGVDEEQSEEQILAALLSSNRLFALLLFFGGGLLLAFTPCVFPMLPILSGIIAGAGDNVSTKRAFVLSLVYVLASTLVFTIAGVVAGLVGANLQALFQKPWILWSFAGLFVVLSLSMFGFYELQLPSALQNRIANVSNRQQGGSLLGVGIMGILSALIVGPCVAPPLAAAVLYISQTRDPLFGGLALFALSLGMGAPLVVAGTAAGRWLPRAGAWMDAVKAVFGVSFLALAIWMLSRILDPVWIMLMAGSLAVSCAVYLGALERLPDGASGWKSLCKALGLLLLLLGAMELIGAAAGSRDVLQPLQGLRGTAAASNETHLNFRRIKSVADVDREIATAAGKPVMLDFYADWCVACKEMEKFTFAKTSVQQALTGTILLKADVTANDDIDQALLRRYGLVGPPVTLFFGTDGTERRSLRLTGFEDADKFVARVAKVNR